MALNACFAWHNHLGYACSARAPFWPCMLCMGDIWATYCF